MLVKPDFLRITGSDALRFLQGMWTGDIKLASKSFPSSLGAYLLDLKARPISPAQILCLSEKEFLLQVVKGRGEAVYAALDKYLVADDVEMELLVGDKAPYNVLHVFESPFEDQGLQTVDNLRVDPLVSKDLSKVFQSKCEDGVYAMAHGVWGPKHFQLWYPQVQELPPFKALSESEITANYVEAGQARWDVDYGENSLILEYPFQSRISFYKGCYIGQEIVARATYRGQLAKSFARFHCDSPAQIGFIFRKDAREKPVGKITSAAGNLATGLLRLREYEKHEHVIVPDDASAEIPINKIEILCSKVLE